MKTKMRVPKASLMILALAMANVVSAQNVHLKPPQKSPSFIDNGLTLTSVGALAGLGEGDLAVTLSAEANATAVCTNPAGANQPAGQNPAPITVSGTQAIPAPDVKNGNTTFNVTTIAPQSPVPGAPGCPNPNWTQSITDLSFLTGTITVEQPLGNTVFTVSCSFASPTLNGAVPANSVSCQ